VSKNSSKPHLASRHLTLRHDLVFHYPPIIPHRDPTHEGSPVPSSNDDAYKYKRSYLGTRRHTIVPRVKALPMIAPMIADSTALQAEDFAQTFETSETMIDTVSHLCSSSDISQTDLNDAKEVCWVSCFQLGRQPKFPRCTEKLRLLGYALKFCPADRLPEILMAWRR
jgi:hypothetical protein